MSMTNYRTRVRLLIGGAWLLLATTVAVAADPAPNSFNGTWVMNASQSKFEKGADPMSAYQTIISDVGSGKVRAQASWTLKDGTKGARDWTAGFDKTEPVSGDPDVDSVKVVSPKPRTIFVRFFKSGKAVEWGRYTVSADGKTLHGTEGVGGAKDAKALYHVVFDRE